MTDTRGKSFVRAQLSLVLLGQATEAAYNARLDGCDVCPFRRVGRDGSFGFCAACNCGTHEAARLEVKAAVPGATCPRNRLTWVVSRGTGPRVGLAAKALATIIGAVIREVGLVVLRGASRFTPLPKRIGSQTRAAPSATPPADHPIIRAGRPLPRKYASPNAESRPTQIQTRPTT